MGSVLDEKKLLDNIFENCDNFQKGLEEKLSEREVTEVLSKLLWEITRNSKDRLIEVRDYDQIAQKGTFRYAGKADTMFKEGLMPEDVFLELKTLPGMKADDTRHIGPAYLRVKGLLTHHLARKFFGRQMAFRIQDSFDKNPLPKPDGFVVCAPNMTGGVYIGDETGKQMKIITKYNAWPATPYMREARKAIDVIAPEEKLDDFWEGLKPSPENTAALCCFEELRTAAETTQNATKIYRHFGYNDENKVRIIETCVFDYRHPVCVKRLERLGVEGLYQVAGLGETNLFDTSKYQGYISNYQCQTTKDWLNDPWEFTREVIPTVRKLGVK